MDVAVHLQLIDEDIDEHDEDIAQIRTEQASARQVLMGILVSLVVASIMLAVNLAVNR